MHLLVNSITKTIFPTQIITTDRYKIFVELNWLYIQHVI
jgi:hypothetical protein